VSKKKKGKEKAHSFLQREGKRRIRYHAQGGTSLRGGKKRKKSRKSLRTQIKYFQPEKGEEKASDAGVKKE